MIEQRRTWRTTIAAPMFADESREGLNGQAIPVVVGAALAALLLAPLFPLAWFSALVVALGIARFPTTNRVVVVGNEVDTAIASSMLQRSVPVLTATNRLEALQLVRNASVHQIVTASAADFAGVADARGVQPEIIDPRDAIGSMLGRIPMQLAGAEDLYEAIARRSRFDAAVRRVMDLAIALPLSVLVVPFIPLIALVIRLDSAGNPFYSQVRVGLNGKHFRIHKFRSMTKNAEAGGARWASKGDNRVTRVGKFLRLSRIDEIPQLWNIIRGDMTLIGPRPERPEFTQKLESDIPGFGLRNLVKPGLTGWAQVSFRYTSSIAETRTKLEYDLFYVKYQSLLLDARILVKTIGVVVKMRGQ